MVPQLSASGILGREASQGLGMEECDHAGRWALAATPVPPSAVHTLPL